MVCEFHEVAGIVLAIRPELVAVLDHDRAVVSQHDVQVEIELHHFATGDLRDRADVDVGDDLGMVQVALNDPRIGGRYENNEAPGSVRQPGVRG